ncbi:MAG: HindIII family type II restriction endonuclease [Planctomycetaceae bacterium]|jgi:type II restriction enzyme|nr:HindIII family type II restriction endonuclease [Planctomycetaceae bacterium]
MNFQELRSIIKEKSNKGTFAASSDWLQTKIFGLKKKELIPIISEIGAIPEDIGHDSTEEKLYAKVSDIVLSKCFQELGLQSSVNTERANCADIVAKSQFHNYSLVGDAKSFRLSRTAKNQKDFKIKSMADWKGDNDYSVLVCPYYQYPKLRSQIYGQALNNNITLFSWEYLSILLENNISENVQVNISNLWNICSTLSININIANKNNCFLTQQNEIVRLYLKLSETQFNSYFERYKTNTITRGEIEIKYWETKITEIKQYTKNQAIKELLSSLKLNEKISSIKKYINFLGGY